MTCKLNHSDPEVIPQCLCYACHPEWHKTPEQRAAEFAALREVAQVENTERQRREEIMRTQARLNALEQRHRGDIGGIDAKVAKSLSAKLERLESGGAIKVRKRRNGKAKSQVNATRHRDAA